MQIFKILIILVTLDDFYVIIEDFVFHNVLSVPRKSF